MAGLIQRERLTAGTRLARKFTKSLWPDVVGRGAPFDAIAPDTVQSRELLVNFDIPLPYPNPTTGLPSIEMWVLFEPGAPAEFPSKLIRVTQGQIFHSVSAGHVGSHTIHWHGIEPTAANDGVGHDSFEIGAYTYQWLAAEAGSYFYHCHKNTVLHFEMGLYGFLIIDPPQGPGRVRAELTSDPTFEGVNHTIAYDVEKVWVCDEMDSRWHTLAVNDFMFPHGGDPNNPASFNKGGILHDFRPDVFVISGVPIPANPTSGQPDGNRPITDPKVAATATVGQTILIRLLNGGYTLHHYTLGIDAIAVASDGRPFGVPPFGTYSRPFTIPANTPFSLSTARRWDLIVKPTQAGVFPFKCDFIDVVTGVKYQSATTTITVV